MIFPEEITKFNKTNPENHRYGTEFLISEEMQVKN